MQAHLKAPQAKAQPKLLKELAPRYLIMKKSKNAQKRDLTALAITGRYMSLASSGFCAPVRQTGTPKPVGALSARLSG
jgi:hypothetical protein